MRLTKPVSAATLGCAALMLGRTPMAHAQPANQPNPPPTQAIDAPQVEHLFGDLGGAQTQLTRDGINVQFDALTEFMGNVDGGVKQGATFANQLTFANDINWERLAGGRV